MVPEGRTFMEEIISKLYVPRTKSILVASDCFVNYGGDGFC